MIVVAIIKVTVNTFVWRRGVSGLARGSECGKSLLRALALKVLLTQVRRYALCDA